MRLRIDTMTCGGCARRITKSIQTVDPAAEVEIDLDGRLVEVRSAQPFDAFAPALTAEGYPAVTAP